MTQDHDQHRPYADEGELLASLNAIRDQIASVDRRTSEQINANRVQSKDQLDRIEQQTVRTNGRVSALELKVSGFELWKAELRGMAQGSGGVGRLLFYILSGGAAFCSILVALLSITGHIK